MQDGNLLIVIFQILILIMSVVIHEVSHGYMALYLGDHTAEYQGRLTLNPLKHIDPVGSILLPILTLALGGPMFGWAKPVPYNPYNLRNQKTSEGWVAAAGPLSNFAIALVFSIIIRVFAGSTAVSSSFIDISTLIVLTNLTLGLFNLVPITPLDGSKILFSILPARFMHIRYSMEKYSMILVIVFIFFLWQYVTPLIGFLFTLLTGIR